MNIKYFTSGVPVEEEAKKQLENVAGLPFIYKHVAVMPDVHWGMGATVGSVIPTQKAIIPAAVGVDIGCGMIAVRTNIEATDLPDNLFKLRAEIEKAIPHGRTHDGGRGDRGAWHDIPELHTPLAIRREILLKNGSFQHTLTVHPELAKKCGRERAERHLGTLGTGNHFIELCLDDEQLLWIMLHSGSRGVGNQIGHYFIEKAKQDMKRWFINLPDQDLAYLPEGSPLFDHYLIAMRWAQDYASLNREIMLEAVTNVLEDFFPDLGVEYLCKAINCHHNYVSKENHFGQNIWITRKGAVRAYEGDLGIIPGSMGAKSYIVRGKGNPESFCSCSHGAGRIMSRTQAKKIITIEDHIKATDGVECRKDEAVIDESPAAYKDIDAVMAAQSELIEIVHTLKQVVCVKG